MSFFRLRHCRAGRSLRPASLLANPIQPQSSGGTNGLTVDDSAGAAGLTLNILETQFDSQGALDRQDQGERRSSGSAVHPSREF
jgi:hypothetical protein